MSRVSLFLLAAITSLGVAATATAADIRVPYSGRATNAEGAPINGTLPIIVTVYDAPSEGEVQFTQTFPTASVQDGYFTVLLDTDTPSGDLLDAGVFASGPRWVGVQIGETTLAPTLIGSTPVAGVAGHVPTTASPSVTCTVGAVTFDTTTGSAGSLKVCNTAGEWTRVGTGNGELQATGGNVTTTSTHRIHTFTASGTFEVTSGLGDVELLVVGGGGGGGKYWSAGGGGAGGVVYEGSYPVSEGVYTVTVGAGGNGSTTIVNGNATQGGSSSFGSVLAIGGGFGRSYPSGSPPAGDGGSGGGGAKYDSNTPGLGGQALQPTSASGGFGNPGGRAQNGGGAGGGGAAQAGENGLPSVAGDGGDGLSYSISGTLRSYGGGGGGGCTSPGVGIPGSGGIGGGGAGSQIGFSGQDGAPNTGGGGGGGGTSGNNDGTGGGDGGSGIVIVRYPL